MMGIAGRRIRVLLFSTLYPSSVRPQHGIFVETRLRELLCSGQVDARVVAPVPWFFSMDSRFGDYALMARTPRRETYNDIDVLHPRYLLPPKVGTTIAPLVLALGALPAVEKLRREGFDFDLIDAHYYYPDGVAAALLARWLGKPFVVTARGSDINLIARLAVPGAMIRWAARRARASIAVSSALADSLAKLGVEAPRRLVLRNGVDLCRFQPAASHTVEALRRTWGWPEGPILLSVGNLVENKGHRLAIEAMAALPGFRLLIVGAGVELPRLAAQIERLGLGGRVKLAGRVAQWELPAYYSAADILVLASSREGWPNVLLESMACGTPVVATAVGGIPEIVAAPEAGCLMRCRSSAALVDAIRDLMAVYPQRDAVRDYARQFSWEATTWGLLRLFAQVAEAGTAVLARRAAEPAAPKGFSDHA